MPDGFFSIQTMFYVYIIQSQINANLYKGMTSNMEDRLKQHNAGKTETTKAFRPWKLIYFEEFDDRNQARAREKYFKSGAGRRYIRERLKIR